MCVVSCAPGCTELTVDGGPRVRIQLPPAKSRANFRFLSGGVRREGGRGPHAVLIYTVVNAILDSLVAVEAVRVSGLGT